MEAWALDSPQLFRDRHDAGRKLARRLMDYRGQPVVVLGLPRGGVPVAYEVAQALGAPLDVFVVRKLGLPGHEELAMGAIASGGVRVLNEDVIAAYSIPAHVLEEVIAHEEQELKRRELDYRGHQQPPAVRGRTAIVIDDGLATGASMRAAVRALRQMQPSQIIVAVPVAAYGTCQDMRTESEGVLCLVTPEPFYSVGSWYEDFSQTTDDEVRELLARA